MAKVFEKKFIVTKQDDGSFTLSIKFNDSLVAVTVCSEAELRQLMNDIQGNLEG